MLEEPQSREPDPSHSLRPRREGELISAVCALLLVVAMIALKWYGVVGRPRSAERSGLTSAVSGWNELTELRWLALITALLALGAVVLHINQLKHGAQTDTGLLVTSLGTFSSLLLAYRVLVDPPSAASVVDIKLGAYLCLLAAIGISVGGFQTVRDERLRGAQARSAHRPHGSLPSSAVPR